MKKFIYLVTLLFVASCSSTSHKKMKEETATFTLPNSPQQNKAIVYIVRPESFGRLIRFKVYLDSKNMEIGNTKGLQYIYFNVEPGMHKILSEAENIAELEIDAKAGDTIFIKQTINPGFTRARNSIEIIDEVQGKYYVKTLKKGTIIKSEMASQ